MNEFKYVLKKTLILSNDIVLKEGDLSEHLSLRNEKKYSEYYCEVSRSYILYQHTATEGHSCLNFTL